MANEEQVRRLLDGVEGWNAWREKKQPGKLDALIEAKRKGEDFIEALFNYNKPLHAELNGANLGGANLSGANLSSADLIGANLGGANLSGANLSSAELIGASLICADLSGADLSGAQLREVSLSGVDLSNADLSNADLSGADLRAANLLSTEFVRANLTCANLTGADLCRAPFSGANLSGADLSGTQLSGANLSDAALCDADLSSSDLRSANLCNTNLSGANLTRASLFGTDLKKTVLIETVFFRCVFGGTSILGTDLSTTIELESVLHSGPSSIGHGTLELTAEGLNRDRSRQAEVEVFYRGAGVPQYLIEFFRSRIGRPIEFFSAFISYSHVDKSFARRLYDGLQGRGIRCWLDEHDMKVGHRILDAVNNAIKLHDKLLLCCSLASLTSSWVEDEIAAAFELERKENRLILIPLDLDGYLFDGYEGRFGPRIRERLAADFTDRSKGDKHFEKKFEKVVQALRPDDP